MNATFASSDNNETNYLCVICEYCKKEMLLDEHSVILGSKWYHAECYDVKPEGK